MRAAAVLLALSLAVVAVVDGKPSSDGRLSRSRRAVTTDFDDHARKWVENKSREVKRKVSWWDLYGKHQHLLERPQYHRFQVSTRTSPMNYNMDVLEENERPQQVYSKWFCNHQSKQPITTTISRELKRRARYTWMQENGIKIGAELSIKATIPSIMDIGASFSTELDFRGRNTEVKEETETFKIQYDLTIDPQTAVRADWVITEKEVEVPYDLDVYIDGYAAVWYDKKVDNHWLWFYPVSHMTGDSFKSYGGGLEFESSGIFNGARGIHSVIEAREYPLVDGTGDQCGGSSYYSSFAPTKITRIPMPLPSDIQHGD